jgi:hypothetical protein
MKRVAFGVAGGVSVVALIVGGFALASKPPGRAVTICHAHPPDANPPNGYNLITVDVASADTAKKLNGHREHTADIIPGFWYPPEGSAGATFYPGQGDQSILANGCRKGETTSTSTTTSTRSTSTTNSTQTTSPRSSTSASTASTTTTGSSSSSTTSSNATSSSTTASEPTTTLPNSTSSTTVAAATSTEAGPPPPTRPASVPPIKPQLERALKRQEKLPGTGRVSHATPAGALPNTGVNEWLVFVLGLSLTLGGLGVRRFAKENA